MSNDNPIRPATQAFSDAMMMTRFVALHLKECALEASSRYLELQKEIMKDQNSKMMAMDGGDIEEGLLQLAAAHGAVKRLHKLANDLGRRLNEPMPKNPSYSSEYLELINKKLTITLSGPARR